MTLGQVSEIGMMLLMPLVFRVATVRWILLVGLLSWAVRYVLLAYGDPGPGVWMFYLAIIMHGVCFDFFFVTGQLYTDQQAPPHLRSTAQGFITAMTYGVGMLIGSLLSGGVLDYFSTTAADGDDHARLDRVLADVRVDVVRDHAAGVLLLPHERANQGEGSRLERDLVCSLPRGVLEDEVDLFLDGLLLPAAPLQDRLAVLDHVGVAAQVRARRARCRATRDRCTCG